MDYNTIQSFLDKFKKLLQTHEFSYVEIIESFKNISKIEVVKEDIVFKNSILYIKSSPIKKNQILIYKQKLLEDLNKKLSPKKVIDIR